MGCHEWVTTLNDFNLETSQKYCNKVEILQYRELTMARRKIKTRMTRS